MSCVAFETLEILKCKCRNMFGLALCRKITKSWIRHADQVYIFFPTSFQPLELLTKMAWWGDHSLQKSFHICKLNKQLRDIILQSTYATATLTDWLKNLSSVFHPMRSKTKTTCTLYQRFSRALSDLQVIAKNSDLLITLSAPVVIGLSNCFRFGFFPTVI